MKQRVEQPESFGPLARGVTAAFITVVGTGVLASVAMIIATQSSEVHFSMLLGGVAGLIFVAPVLVPLVVVREFRATISRTMGVASVLCISASVIDGGTYPRLSFYGGALGAWIGALSCFWSVPRYYKYRGTVICRNCGYALEGLPAANPCPECGTEPA